MLVMTKDEVYGALKEAGKFLTVGEISALIFTDETIAERQRRAVEKLLWRLVAQRRAVRDNSTTTIKYKAI